MDPAGYADDVLLPEGAAIRAIKDKLKAVFRWVQAKAVKEEDSGRFRGWLNPATGEFDPAVIGPENVLNGEILTVYNDCWRPLGMEGTPMVVLSSLAPGIDTLAAEAALECAAEGLPIMVRAPLPFPPHRYSRASSFTNKGARDQGKRDRLAQLVRRLRRQPGFQKQRDLFEVALDNDLQHDAAAAISEPNETDPVKIADAQRRRRIRYRAAGEFVATHSDLLLTVYDETKDKVGNLRDLTVAGAATIELAKRQGLSYELLAIANNFSWADNGPVLRIPINRGEGSGATACDRPLCFLHPYDTRPAAVPEGEDLHPLWQQKGDLLFRRILSRQQSFNHLEVDPVKLGAALDAMVGGVKALPEGAVQQYCRLLDTLARARKAAGDASGKWDGARIAVLKKLIWAIGIGAVALSMYEHWEEGHGAGEEAVQWINGIQIALLMIGIICVTVSGITFWKYRRSGIEERRHDHRSLAEGLRVQFYWCLAGSGRSVAAEYMQRQRNELDWIRYVIASLTFPYEQWRRRFQRLTKGEKLALLGVVRKGWVGEQKSYFSKAAKKEGILAHGWHLWGWACGAAGLINIVGHLLAELSHSTEHHFHKRGWEVGLILIGLGFLWLPAAERKWVFRGIRPEVEDEQGGHDRPASTFIGHVFGSAVIWSGGMILGGLVLVLTQALANWTDFWPSWHNWWIIWTGAMLVIGGLGLAYSERRLYAEHTRKYAAMEDLFTCADRRLADLLRQYEVDAPDSPEEKRTFQEIQDLLYQLGCEALDENAEWLILHRSRPLEPVLGG